MIDPNVFVNREIRRWWGWPQVTGAVVDCYLEVEGRIQACCRCTWRWSCWWEREVWWLTPVFEVKLTGRKESPLHPPQSTKVLCIGWRVMTMQQVWRDQGFGYEREDVGKELLPQLEIVHSLSFSMKYFLSDSKNNNRFYYLFVWGQNHFLVDKPTDYVTFFT